MFKGMFESDFETLPFQAHFLTCPNVQNQNRYVITPV